MERHISIATASRLSGFPSVEHRRRAARAVVRVLGRACPLFCVADDHAHALVTALPERIPQLAGSLVQALRFVSEHPLAPAYIGEVRSRTHLRTLVPYVLDQTTHHGIVGAEHPALWEGSSFLDLVGARLIPGFLPGTLRELLPRLTSHDVWDAVGLEPLPPADDAAIAVLGPPALADAARVCLALASLRGKEPRVVGARRVLTHLAVRGGARTAAIADTLEISVRAVQRNALRPEDAAIERAIRLWVAIRTACASSGRAPTPR